MSDRPHECKAESKERASSGWRKSTPASERRPSVGPSVCNVEDYNRVCIHRRLQLEGGSLASRSVRLLAVAEAGLACFRRRGTAGLDPRCAGQHPPSPLAPLRHTASLSSAHAHLHTHAHRPAAQHSQSRCLTCHRHSSGTTAARFPHRDLSITARLRTTAPAPLPTVDRTALARATTTR